MIALIGDVHNETAVLHDLLARIPPEVRTIVQVGDMWVWPAEGDVPPHSDGSPRQLPSYPSHPWLQWRHPVRDMAMIDGNHHNFWLTRSLTQPTRVAAGLLYLPRGIVTTLPGRHGDLRVGFLGGADSVIDAPWRRLGDDWWPEEERVAPQDVDRLLMNAKGLGGLDLLVTHTPPATITTAMTGRSTAHPSAIMVEEAWRSLGGGVPDAPLELVCGHMHTAYTDEVLRVEVLDYLGVTLR